MTTIGVMINPHSYCNRSGIDDLVSFLSAQSEINHVILQDVAEIPATLRRFADAGVDLVTVAGGDGTLQLALTHLFTDEPFEKLPLLAVLPRGRTNMSAANIGVSGRGARGLSKLIAAASGPRLADHVVERRIVCVENTRDHGPQYGMFFGGAGIWRAIDYCRRKVHPYRVGSAAVSAITLARLFGRWLIRGRDDELFGADPVAITIDGEDFGVRPSLVVLATTLDRLLLRSRPFWNIDGAAMAFTQISFPPRRPLRNACRVLYGADRTSLPETYFSRGADRVTLGLSGPMTIDGAYFEPTPGREIVLTATRKAGFVRL